MFSKILHANDGSDHAFKALSLALQIARHDNAALHMVSIEEKGHMPKLAKETDAGSAAATVPFDQVVRRARFMAEASQVTFHTHILAGHAARDVARLAADLGADLIVVGSTGHSAIYDRMIGTPAQKILYHAACPVLVVR